MEAAQQQATAEPQHLSIDLQLLDHHQITPTTSTTTTNTNTDTTTKTTTTTNTNTTTTTTTTTNNNNNNNNNNSNSNSNHDQPSASSASGILGPQLVQVGSEGLAAFATSQQSQSSTIEILAAQLQDKLRAHADSRNQYYHSLYFVEPALETSFRDVTFSRQRRAFVLALLALATVTLAALIMDVLVLCRGVFGELPLGADNATAAGNATTSCSREGYITVGLRGAQLFLLCASALVAYLSRRLPALVTLVVTVWIYCALNNVALYYHQLEAANLVGPPESSYNFFILFAVYTLLIPGMPFSMVCTCGWGLMLVTVGTHCIIWGAGSRVAPADYLIVLGAEMAKEFIANVFGTFTAYEQLSEMRYNYYHAKLLVEALELTKFSRKQMHMLTLNTLPAPIVEAIGSDDTTFVRVYPQTTVLQADMVGFTVLSSQLPPQVVLGFLSDIFDSFDDLCAVHRVDKVKTIGDAYIVCAGALRPPRADDAARIIQMGLDMQKVVAAKAANEGVSIAVRIGVHTGTVTGGIIGTRRFHFDMWGRGVNGAITMEETGDKGRVHISDAAAKLVQRRFELEQDRSDGELSDGTVALGISSTYWVIGERAASPEPLLSTRLAVEGAAGSCEGAEGDSAGAAAGGGSSSTAAANGAVPAPLSGGRSMLIKGRNALQFLLRAGSQVRRSIGSSIMASRSSRWSFDSESITPRPANVVDAISGRDDARLRSDSHHFFAKAHKQPGGSGGPSTPRSGKGAAGDAAVRPSVRPSTATRKPMYDSTSKAAMAEAAATLEETVAMATRDSRSIDSGESPGRGSRSSSTLRVSMADRASTAGRQGNAVDARESVGSGEEAREQPKQAVLELLPDEVIDSLRRSSYLLVFLVLFSGVYDWAEWHSHEAVRVGGMRTFENVLLMRYIGGLLACSLISVCLTVLRGRIPVGLAQWLNVAIITLPFLCIVTGYFMGPDVNRQYMLFIALVQINYGYTTLALSLPVLVCIQCAVSAAHPLVDVYLLRFNRDLRDESLLCAARRTSDPGSYSWPCNASSASFPVAVLLIVGAQMIGILHNIRRRSGLRNHAHLLHEHQQNMNMINEEVAHCRSLLENVFSPEVLRQLRGNFPGMHRMQKRLAQEFTECTFLFCKVVGLRSLTDDETQDGAKVVEVLQCIFNIFDELVDMYKVQKVRKTVNEYYMVAAGLPDQFLLEDEEERAVATAALALSMVNVMEVINSELYDLDLQLDAQIGIHSGTAIAGIIGHKRFQYDLCGDAVNTAARMCSYSSRGCVCVSAKTYELLKDRFAFFDRGEFEVKGKGQMRLYYLLGRHNEAIRLLREDDGVSTQTEKGREARLLEKRRERRRASQEQALGGAAAASLSAIVERGDSARDSGAPHVEAADADVEAPTAAAVTRQQPALSRSELVSPLDRSKAASIMPPPLDRSRAASIMRRRSTRAGLPPDDPGGNSVLALLQSAKRAQQQGLQSEEDLAELSAELSSAAADSALGLDMERSKSFRPRGKTVDFMKGGREASRSIAVVSGAAASPQRQPAARRNFGSVFRRKSAAPSSGSPAAATLQPGESVHEVI